MSNKSCVEDMQNSDRLVRSSSRWRKTDRFRLKLHLVASNQIEMVKIMLEISLCEENGCLLVS